MPKIAVIGSGFSGLSAAAYLAKAGHEVHVFEKNKTPGGRARQLVTEQGYVFDMGPSWYWMPDVFDSFFGDFGRNVSDLYPLHLLDPAFEMVFGKSDVMPVPADYTALKKLFEQVEPGAGEKLDRFLSEARIKYELSMKEFIYKPGLSIREYITMQVIRKSVKLSLFSSFSKHVRKFFSHPRLIALMEFPVLFLGAMPDETPALYSLMNYAGLSLGTWYPEGGFGKVVDEMVKLGSNLGANFHFNARVEQVVVEDRQVSALLVNGEPFNCDGVIAAGDYHHVEQELLPAAYRNYKSKYWATKTFAPSCLIFYIGVRKKIPKLRHHTLFFDESITEHAQAIYKTPAWPEKPLFYVSCTSKSDDRVAPAGHENLFILIPLAPGLNDDEEVRERYFNKVMQRLEIYAGEPIAEYIDYKKSYCVSDFISDYHAYKGNAYGLANTLSQTAIWKPRMTNNKLKNLFYTGQLTVPGPGVPPAIISGKISAGLLSKHFKKRQS
jgi:phytoene desaturase